LVMLVSAGLGLVLGILGTALLRHRHHRHHKQT
jgi:Co/Zn/Cd efflux system component